MAEVAYVEEVTTDQPSEVVAKGNGQPVCVTGIDGEWADGPAEVFVHGKALAAIGTEGSKRLAFLVFHNAVELALVAFIGQASSRRGKPQSPVDWKFNDLLDHAERYLGSAIDGFDRHALWAQHLNRNLLYHRGGSLVPRENDVLQLLLQTERLLVTFFGSGCLLRADREVTLVPSREPGDLAARYGGAADELRLRLLQNPHVPVAVIVPASVWDLLDDLNLCYVDIIESVDFDDDSMMWLSERLTGAPTGPEEINDPEAVIEYLDEAARIFGLLGR